MGMLEGSVSIVTGAARGLGKAIAFELAREGAYLVIVDLRSDLLEKTVEEIKSLNTQAISVIADVSKPESVKKLVDITISSFGTVDILVNNAGIMRTTRPMEEISFNVYISYWSFTSHGHYKHMH